MTLQEAIQDIHALNAELEVFEKEYGLLSEDFFQLYVAGELRDEEPEEIRAYGRWAGFYEAKLHRIEIYKRLLADAMQTLRESAPAGGLALVPTAVLSKA
jgi:hypothetical protein